MIVGSYIFPQEYSFIKISAGTGYNFFKLTEREFGIERKFTGNGITLRAEATLTLQMSNSMAVYLGGSLSSTFSGAMLDENGNVLKNPVSNEDVNLDNFGTGLKLGMEIYFF